MFLGIAKDYTFTAPKPRKVNKSKQDAADNVAGDTGDVDAGDEDMNLEEELAHLMENPNVELTDEQQAQLNWMEGELDNRTAALHLIDDADLVDLLKQRHSQCEEGTSAA